MAENSLVIIVTGANCGVGFGVCHRLLFQLSRLVPPDTTPQPFAKDINPGTRTQDFPPCNALTLIMACRNREQSKAARTQLLALLDAEIETQRLKSDYDGHAEMFRKNLKIDIIPVDLVNANSVLDFCDEVGHKYPFVSHLILNAGAGDFQGLDWLQVAWDVLTDLKKAVTYPSYKLQGIGRLSNDGLGWVWQCNVFGHYLMARNLQSMLGRCPHSSSRVLWTSSIEAQVDAFDFNDWQLTRAPRSYEASKYQGFLVAHALGERASRTDSKVRHFVVHPGVVASSMFKEYLGWLLDKLMVLVFYISRFFGSHHHCISGYKGAISAVHICLVSLALLPLASVPVAFGSRTTRLGQEYVATDYIEGWADREESTKKMLDKFDILSAALERKWNIAKKE